MIDESQGNGRQRIGKAEIRETTNLSVYLMTVSLKVYVMSYERG